MYSYNVSYMELYYLLSFISAIGFSVDFSIKKLSIYKRQNLLWAVTHSPKQRKENNTMGSITALTLTSSMFDSLLEAINTNLGVLLPIGLTVMAIMIGVSLIPRIIYKFF